MCRPSTSRLQDELFWGSYSEQFTEVDFFGRDFYPVQINGGASLSDLSSPVAGTPPTTLEDNLVIEEGFQLDLDFMVGSSRLHYQ
jgi:hypothetical protein